MERLSHRRNGRAVRLSRRDALTERSGKPQAPPDFALSESPRFVGRAVAALASDPDKARWNQRSVHSGELARAYGFADLDGSQPDVWRYIEDAHDGGRDVNLSDYR